jgi:hypothetical protein
MTAAEDQARRLGCALVEFRAYDLLARGLHERLGYETVGVINGYPAGNGFRDGSSISHLLDRGTGNRRSVSRCG